MSYHSPETSGKKTLGGSTARMPSMAVNTGANMTANTTTAKLKNPVQPTIGMDELGIATSAEKSKRGYLSTFLEGQTPLNKLSSFLGSK